MRKLFFALLVVVLALNSVAMAVELEDMTKEELIAMI